MRMPERNGKRKTREQRFKPRKPELGYYVIVTDTEATEQNYVNGLRDSLPKELQKKIVIKVCEAKKTSLLVEEALKLASQLPIWGEVWIVFDRDRVVNFDQIISDAQAQEIKVGWSNPCIEIWFSAYFGSMPPCQDSVSCCRSFAQRFKQVTGQEYKKSDDKIYQKLCHYGDEAQALRLAREKHQGLLRGGNAKPSEMYPCTTVYTLVEEIAKKKAP